MATTLLRTVDRWRFETPLALALAAAAGFATIAMPADLFARVPVAGGFGHAGHIALAVAAALVCGLLGYVAMRRPAKPVASDEETDGEDIYGPVVAPVADVVVDGPIRMRRADRHPDAPPRAPIRASRDLGEPFMEVGSPVAPVVIEPAPDPARTEPELERETVSEPEIVPPVETAAIAAPAAEQSIEPLEVEAAVEPAEDASTGLPAASNPVVALVRHAAPAREDTSLAAMIERLSAGMERGSEPGGRPFAPARDRQPALRDALDELNRLAARRG